MSDDDINLPSIFLSSQSISLSLEITILSIFGFVLPNQIISFLFS